MATAFTGRTLRTIRALRGITQAELADLAGVSPTAIAEFERDKRELRTGTVSKICKALGVSVTYSVGGVEISDKPPLTPR